MEEEDMFIVPLLFLPKVFSRNLDVRRALVAILQTPFLGFDKKETIYCYSEDERKAAIEN
jgi:hypothetical protein